MATSVPPSRRSGANIHRRALRDRLALGIIVGLLMYSEEYGPPWRGIHPIELAVDVVSAVLSAWLIWGYGFYWAFDRAWIWLFERDR